MNLGGIMANTRVIISALALALSLSLTACSTTTATKGAPSTTAPSTPAATAAKASRGVPSTGSEETPNSEQLPSPAPGEKLPDEPPPAPPGPPPAQATRPADFVDAGCARTKATFNDGFYTYWLSEGRGLVGFRLYANLDLYDLCNHGGIWGTVAVYDANVKAKNGQVQLGRQYVNYNRSGISGWQNANVYSVKWTDYAGWSWYYVYTDNNVGMSARTYFDYVKVSAYITFDNVPGAGRRETCVRSRNTWNCQGHVGL
jgi:hypothetical protein